jgi:putative GTP pyrophosphokinase
VTGVRITTYFSDEVDKIAEHLEKEFEIVKEHSVDKRKTIDADRFGYLLLQKIGLDHILNLARVFVCFICRM